MPETYMALKGVPLGLPVHDGGEPRRIAAAGETFTREDFKGTQDRFDALLARGAFVPQEVGPEKLGQIMQRISGTVAMTSGGLSGVLKPGSSKELESGDVGDEASMTERATPPKRQKK